MSKFTTGRRHVCVSDAYGTCQECIAEDRAERLRAFYAKSDGAAAKPSHGRNAEDLRTLRADARPLWTVLIRWQAKGVAQVALVKSTGETRGRWQVEKRASAEAEKRGTNALPYAVAEDIASQARKHLETAKPQAGARRAPRRGRRRA